MRCSRRQVWGQVVNPVWHEITYLIDSSVLHHIQVNIWGLITFQVDDSVTQGLHGQMEEERNGRLDEDPKSGPGSDLGSDLEADPGSGPGADLE